MNDTSRPFREIYDFLPPFICIFCRVVGELVVFPLRSFNIKQNTEKFIRNRINRVKKRMNGMSRPLCEIYLYFRLKISFIASLSILNIDVPL